ALVFIAGKDPATAIGGHSSYVRAHGLAAVAAGHTPHVFCVGAASGRVETDFGVVHRVASPLRTVRHPTMVAHSPFLAAAVRRFLGGRAAPHLVHSFGPWAFAGAAVVRRLRRQGIAATAVANAYTTLEHDWRGKLAGLGWRQGAGRRLLYTAELLWIRAVAAGCERRGYEGSRLVVVNYESVRRLVAAACRRQVEIRRLPYAASAAFAEQTAALVPVPPAVAALRPAAAPLIVAVARHDPRKGLDRLLRCLAGLQAEGTPFRACLVGPGTLLEAHRRLATRLGLGASTAIPGRVPDPDDYLRHADLFVLPSLEEGSGSVALLEALQAGCAVIASACDGIPEDLVDGASALLVPAGDAAALQAALARALGDTALRQRLAAGARATFAARFSRAPFVAALGGLYAELGCVP
ncbi:MAG TPA: glycosyltransferase, partial [Thermoanaerobaculia bacterium]|nr:glycosyltransferase [Thermoanaerobaculia bacterium]